MTEIDLAFQLRHVIHIPSFIIVCLLCREHYFSDITYIDDKTKYRSPIYWMFLSLNIDTKTKYRSPIFGCFFALLIKPYKDVFRTSERNV